VEAERRQVTVLFTDMVAFAAFWERSGEEAAYTLMRSLSKLMDDAVHEQGGVVQSFTGDGIMAVFGAPIAFEDAPLRACRAALDILNRLKAAAPDLEAKHRIQPLLRIGLNTGAAIVGRVQQAADAGITVLGDTVNFAARLQALAEPRSVFMSDATHRLVQGLVDVSFAGEHTVKGKSEPQKVYRLNAVRKGTSRFEAAIGRGLSAFIGREHELEVMERSLEEARSQPCVLDLVAEPGMGKSRLVYEFRRRVNKESAFILTGSCSTDGQQTPFLPFIEVVRGSFQVSGGEAEKEIARKLKMGLIALGLQSDRNLGLLLHLLGLTVPEGALAGLDGLLIGLRTRELLQQLLEARCRLSPLVMIVEDLQWLDSASEELLDKIISGESKLRLLLLTTRRPEYAPGWLDGPNVTKLPLEPLPTGDIRHLVQARLGVEALPEALARILVEKAEGNPLFAEEIITFLTERGALQTIAGKLDFDVSGMATALPTSVQGVLTARVDRLAPNDRVILQAASVIGRRFDPLLLACAVDETNINDRLITMQALDLILWEGKSGDYVFKHALVRDALYQSLLAEPRISLHLRIANEIERRSGNRLTEVAEVLAHHYAQTNLSDKAFAFLSMAGSKSLSVYSIAEATRHLTAALAILDETPDCASDSQVAEFVISYAYLLTLGLQIRALVGVLERHLERIDRLGSDPRVVLVRHHYVHALWYSSRYREMAAVQRQAWEIANQLTDARSKAYVLTAEILIYAICGVRSVQEFDVLKREAINAASQSADAYIQSWTRFVIGWKELHSGRMTEARSSAHDQLNDPRSIGSGLALLTWVSLVSDCYAEALEYSEQALSVAVTPFDRVAAENGKGCALVLLRRTEEGINILELVRRRCIVDGVLYFLSGQEGVIGICKVLQGNIKEGINQIESAILNREKEGYRDVADWLRLFLSEIYLQIIGGNEKLPFMLLLRNLSVLVKLTVTASSRIRVLMALVLENPRLDPAGHHVGRAQMILGLLYKIKRKRALAIQHLTEAKRILSPFGQTPILVRVETALAELEQQP
jgi:class 3 adenylate cyclase/tetratricopeptide (TPR) repeat protein